MPIRFTGGPLLALTAMLAASPAWAADEEIQVYLDEIGARGEFGLDLHLSYVLDGDGTPAYPGAESPRHRLRITPELSLGLGGGFELGAYIPVATVAADGVARVQGIKGRLKWLAPHKDQGLYWGINWELGRVAHRLDENPWNSEVKLIAGWREERWNLGVNGNFGFKVSGPVPAPATFEIATKAGYKVSDTLTLGVESYNELGELRSLAQFSGTEHATYLTADFPVGGFDINAGVGKGYGANADSWLVKFVVGVPVG